MIKYILSHTNVAINYFGFSIVWICCVYSGAQGVTALALIPTLIFLYLHFMIVADHLKEEVQLILIAILMGVIVDSSFSFFGVVSYNGNISSIPHLAPIWILCMWAGFSAQINHAMNRLRGRYLLVGFYGLLAPLAYMGGEKINAASITDGDINYAIISISWAISLVVLFKISEYLMAK
ncbi:MAG: DUF2878 domain-containing protein [Candidatus Marinimicrobia bacterium]|jgi:hypothetical protein|nr:DUF2878 domain-containing protein [Gammaproteobacteria bacterium]MBT3727872.1 DUF2878 domain-containing protein [Candidatus Neomarinimicrobiota bacterium]MBT3943875.1 DUF2878 domain-containing protein [Candidatus Neomarinimicrobiota bacterium]MBT4111929.1 DUF2878 domain-containing protein [Candidatus Neomarinimicrobiota bacterium]MBT4317285.1 DUF2878 domain-containing protein [Candidatus Neomarinimicrobiota bacterium]